MAQGSGVRLLGPIPFRLSARAQGLTRIAPGIIRVPDWFFRRFRANRAREFRIHSGTALVVDGNGDGSSLML